MKVKPPIGKAPDEIGSGLVTPQFSALWAQMPSGAWPTPVPTGQLAAVNNGALAAPITAVPLFGPAAIHLGARLLTKLSQVCRLAATGPVGSTLEMKSGEM